MLLPQLKEREYRFKLALRIGLPIFGLILALISHTFITTYDTLEVSFYVESAMLLIVSIYFTFYIIYRGFNKNIIDRVTNTFSNEYLMEHLKKEIKNSKIYTLILFSVDNLYDINSMYTYKNGNKVLLEVAKWVGEYFESKGIDDFVIGHLKSGDFLLGFEGSDAKYKTMLEIMCIKMSDFKVDDIEVKISSAIVDTSYSKDLEYLLEHLFEMQKQKSTQIDLDPSELELLVIDSIKSKSFVMGFQDVFETKTDKIVIKECFVKLKSKEEKLLYPKSYMKVIQKYGLVVEYDLMVLSSIIKSIKKDETIAINVSPISLRNPIFLSSIKEMIGKKLEDKRVLFIISEQEYYSNISRFNHILNSLRELGFFIVLDRLGSLHTSFLYLRDLDIDMVRFDAFYTKDFNKHRYIVDGLNEMAHKKGLKTWIKMVQDKETKELVIKSDIDYIQGNFLASIK